MNILGRVTDVVYHEVDRIFCKPDDLTDLIENILRNSEVQQYLTSHDVPVGVRWLRAMGVARMLRRRLATKGWL